MQSSSMFSSSSSGLYKDLVSWPKSPEGPSPRLPPGGSPPPPFLTPLATPGCVTPKQRQQATSVRHDQHHDGKSFAAMLRLLVADLHDLSKRAFLVETTWALNEASIPLDSSDVPQDNPPGACLSGAACANIQAPLATKESTAQRLERSEIRTTQLEALVTQTETVESMELKYQASSHRLFNLRAAWCDFSDEVLAGYAERYANSVWPTPSQRLQSVTQRSSLRGSFQSASSLSLYGYFVLHPSARRRLFWNIICLAFIAYDLFAVPMMAFPTSEHPPFVILDWIGAFWWTIDIAIAFRTGYFASSQLEMRPVHIAKRYMKTWLVPDLVFVGFDWFSTLSQYALGEGALRSTHILRALRTISLVRIVKMKRLWAPFEHFVQSGMLHSLFDVFKLMSLLLLNVHIIACVWFAIGDSTQGWVTYYSPESPKPKHDVFFWYSASTRWTLAQINGRTDMDKNLNMPELVYTCIIALVFAVILMAILISLVTSLMMDISTSVEHKTSLLSSVRHYLKRQPVSAMLVSSVHHSLAHDHLKENRNEEEDRVLGALPHQLADDLLHEVRMSVCLGHEWFVSMDLNFPRTVRHLCHAASHLICAQRREIVFEKGDACERMLFVDQGVVQYDTEPDELQHDPDLATKALIDHDRPVSLTQQLGQRLRGRNGDCSVHFRGDSSDQRGLRLQRGVWLSEAALWVEWTNLGRLTSGSDAGQAWLIAFNMQEFTTTIRHYAAAYAMSVVFARQFVKNLREAEELSDLLAL